MIKKYSMALFLFLLIGETLTAQILGSTTGSGYYLGRQEQTELLYPVKIWGEVVRPGIYDVPLTSDIIGIISYAGGPTNMAKLTNVRLLRNERTEDGEKILIIVDIEKYIETGDKSLLPIIRPGDTIMIPPKFMKQVTDVLGPFSAILSVINVFAMTSWYLSRP
ncbi:MAG: SLBB domain-containing protein [Candidatus Marinimicrobia bacterium]|nr:SLBB domain-containing protein [Candidatus Neomarinimicrobiota bacterium]